MTKLSRLFFDSPARYLLFLAAILQLTLVLGLYTMGRLAVSPKQIDEHGLLTSVFADTQIYQPQATDAVETLKHSGIKAWLLFPADAHVKLYSLSYLVFGPLVGNNIVGAEPLNLVCYLAILILVAKFGTEVLDQRAGRAAAAAVAVWPSFLLHNAQVLKDPICVIALLTSTLVMALWLTRKLSWRMGLLTGLLGGAAIGLIYATRAGFWIPVILGFVLIGAALLIVRQISQRSLLVGNILSMSLLLLFAVGSLFFTEGFLEITRAWTSPHRALSIPQNAQPSAATVSTPQNAQTAPVAQSSPRENQDPPNVRFPLHSPPERTNRLVIKIQQVRDSFAYRYQDSGTLIDQDVEFITVADVLRYLPRAIEIGFLAPFPNKWLAPGRIVGLAGRLLSGGEMLAAYIIELLALFGVWRARDRLTTWLLFCTILFGVTTLGLGLNNVGALYRMRYGFFVLLIMLGMYGLTQVRQSIPEYSVVGEDRLAASGSIT
jgi:hypothetical protein